MGPNTAQRRCLNAKLLLRSAPFHQVTLSELLGDESRFVHVPADWHVVVTDIRNSTIALGAGRHEIVNLIATGSIIATLNLARKRNVGIPFFFGGDGAIMLVPNVLLEPVIRALTTHRKNGLANFDLDLRVGSVCVADLLASHHGLKISRLHISTDFSISVVLGSGLSEAEAIVKRNDQSTVGPPAPDDELDLDGMECRWDRVEPETPSHEVVSLLVTAGQHQSQGPLFRQVIDHIDDIYGSPESRNPVSVSRLRLKGSKVALEMRMRLGRFSLPYLLRNWTIVQWGRLFFMRRDRGRYYLERLVELTDTIVIDGRINTVVAGTSDQRRQLDDRLSAMERDGLLTYGLFVSRESVMSCYVRDRRDKHIHFVDGADGGYTMAAKMWKGKQGS